MASEQTTQTTQKTTTTVNATVKAESTGVLDNLRFNPLYFKTIPGIIKIVQLVIGIICMGCGAPAKLDFAHFFLFVVVICFLITLLLCIDMLFTLKNVMPKLPWIECELIYTAAAALLYLIAAIVELTMSTKHHEAFTLKIAGLYEPYVAAGVFALFNTVAYAGGAFLQYQEWRASRSTN